MLSLGQFARRSLAVDDWEDISTAMFRESESLLTWPLDRQIMSDGGAVSICP